MTAELNPQQRFDSLVIGTANRLAATAARAVAEAPGSVYNPLFIYARPGLGKTHLLMAIGHAVREVNPGLTVDYLTLDAFIESFTSAVAAGQGDAYRRSFDEVGLLLVDDVQFLSQRREMQAELLRVADQLLAAGRQVVLTSDRPPSEIEALDERLIRRFAGGLVIDIAAPDYETRVAILRRKADERGTTFGPGVLEAVASLDLANVRELVGAVNRLMAFQSVSDTPIDAAQATVLVGGTAALLEGPSVPPAASPGAEQVQPAAESVAVPPELPSEPQPEPEPEPAAPDEFGDFLSEVASTVAQQVEAWRTRIGAAMLRWEGEGYRVGPLERLLAQEVPADPEQALRAFEADVARLQQLEAEAVELAPDLAGNSAFRNPADLAAAEALVERARAGAHPPPAPSPIWRLDEFAEGATNRMAVRAVQAVAQDPGTKYNPLVIVGRTGSGKTHLLHGLGNALAERGLIVACLGAQEFIGELIEALDRGAIAAWQSRYRRADAFLLDDVQLLAGKNRTQDELFLLFNLLLESGRQLAFTSALPLMELEGIEPRLLTRFEGGLVIDLPVPDRDVRLVLVERVLRDKLGDADPELMAYLAGRPAESARAVQGLVQRVVNAAETRQSNLSVSLAREVLEGAPAKQPRRPVTRTSGVIAPTGGGIRSREKTVWDWPDLADRIVEDWR